MGSGGSKPEGENKDAKVTSTDEKDVSEFIFTQTLRHNLIRQMKTLKTDQSCNENAQTVSSVYSSFSLFVEWPQRLDTLS